MKECKYRIPPNKFVFREEDDGALLFNPDSGNIQALNRTGAIILKSCIRGATISQLTKILKKKFAMADEKKIRRDVTLFIKKLKKCNILMTE